MVLATGAFIASLLGIILLFTVKYREAKTGHTYFPTLRDASDDKALALKRILMHTRFVIEQLPPIAVILMRNLVRVIALRFASILKHGENQAHRIADIVSYKHRFQPREPRSEFLKQVSDHKNGTVGRDTIVTDPDEIAG